MMKVWVDQVVVVRTSRGVMEEEDQMVVDNGRRL